jgi:hypothetical protein
MAHKKKMNQNEHPSPYSIEDAIKITDEIFNLSKEKRYNVGAFIHGLIFALEYAQFSYKIPQQQIATIKRDCRRYFKEISNVQK